MREATFTGITQYMAPCCINRYNINRSLTMVLLYGHHIMKSVPVGTYLRIIIKTTHSNHMPYISTHRFSMSGYEYM